MSLRLKSICIAYYLSWWKPSAIYLVLFSLFLAGAQFNYRFAFIVSNVMFVLSVVAFLSIFAVSIFSFFKRRWIKGVINILLLFLCVCVSFLAMILALFFSMFAPVDDKFADNLIIPSDIEVALPLSKTVESRDLQKDSFQKSLLASLSTAGSSDATISANIYSLVRLQTGAPEILIRYLASNPAWRVFEERGSIFATRRWIVDSCWHYELHGYYSYRWGAGTPKFQSRFTIGFSGKPWARVRNNATEIEAGQTGPLKLSMGNKMYQSRCVIYANEILVEVFEQSESQERRLTKAALSYVENELKQLADNPNLDTICSILPPSSIKNGEPIFELYNSSQLGIYDSEIWINPGEPGMLYLKAFEVTKETPLSARRLKTRSNEWVGWSDDQTELFLSNTHFTIYEGDWDKKYAARFEVWFSPDSGEADRKLIEKVFQINGWQR